MLAQLLAQLLGPGDRIDAVHTHFDSRSSSDGLSVMFTTLALALLLCAVLVLLHRVQRARQRREEQAGAERRRDLTASPTQKLQMTQTMSLLKKQPTARGR